MDEAGEPQNCINADRLFRHARCLRSAADLNGVRAQKRPWRPKGASVREAVMYVGSAIIFVWGVGHLIPTRSVVSGFSDLPPESRRIVTMGWIAEGLTLCFIGVLGALTGLFDGLASPAGRAVVRASAMMLFVMAGLTAATGARTSVGPMRACPIVKSVVAALYVAAAGM
jgi:hypothetical protein